eukprot:TRINITY_DN14027_c0_g1::TRINITY_DN14027_c0_g1_i1::g.14492::m.14492 TRINITY_DN14027_c0_g1::TRINITY_DN14027_c0_g1_i1::g.14492  ORF type:complete len:147 (+),score=31.95,sp/Q96G28/CFA36_HUMAN/31.58/2e-07,ARL2_Bind_BART/PF11527.3/1.5e-21,DUF3447/PF11929.3/2e+03,DUF3447/PF11929.3/0.012 TRINITY_DN14027_c0_g1_i1:98-538(+)
MTTEGGNDADARVLILLEDFFCSPDWTTKISNFISENAHFFTVGEEQTHENFERYQAYTNLIESLLEGFLTQHGISPQQLIQLCLDKGGLDQTCIDYILASTEYEYFARLMSDFQQLQDWNENDVAELDPVWDCLPEDDDDADATS